MKPLRLALAVQKCIPGLFDLNLEKTLNAVKEAAKKKADLIVFPEMNLTGYMAGPGIISIARPVDNSLTQILSQAACRYDMTILTGLAEKDSYGNIFATHLVVSPDDTINLYRKTHLAPNEKEYFTPGDRVTVFKTRKLNFGVQLCYDAHFPELSTHMALNGADMIFIAHASPRGTSKEKFKSWIRHLTARAFDNGIYITALNQTGDNGSGLCFPGLALIIGPDGNVLSKFIDPRETVHVAEVDPGFLDRVRSHRMRYFLPNRRPGLYQ